MNSQIVIGYTLHANTFFFNEQNSMRTRRGERSHRVLLWMLDSEMPAVVMGETFADKQAFPLNADVQTGIRSSCDVSFQRNTAVLTSTCEMYSVAVQYSLCNAL